MRTTNYNNTHSSTAHQGPNFGTVHQTVHNHAGSSSPEAEGLRCLTDLRVTDPRIDKKRIEDHKGGLLEGSYKWILAHPDYLRWRDDDQSRLLWVKGDPGKGKTMLLIGIVNELERFAQPQHAEQSTSHTIQSTSQAAVLSFFFCQGTESSLNNAVAVLRGLIFLLATQQPSLVSHLRDKYNHSGPRLFEGANAFFALSDILSGMLRDPSLARAYVVIDALDECQTDLQRLLKLIVESTSASRVKWIVSSRNRPDIEQQLKLDGSQTRLELELKANAQHVSRAVSAYIDEKVSQLVSLQDDDELRHKVADVLRQKADGTFLWVALVIKELQNVESHYYVLAVLEEMPKGLEELYGRMIKQIQQLKRKDPEFCRLVLSAAILAYRPLHLLELGLLSGLPDEISSKAERVQAIIKMCGALLTVRDNRVYIIHQSAKDYLSGEAASTMFPSGREEVHHGIFLQSLHSMRNSLRRDIYGLHHPGFSIDDLKIPDPDPMASVRYSCVHWVDHLCEAQRRDDLADGGPVHEFLECYLLYWIEALCLCKAMSDGVFAMAKLEMLLKPEKLRKPERVRTSARLIQLTRLLQIRRPPKTLNIDSALASLTLDAHRFLLYGLGIKNAPLQTYVSALLFSPAASSTRELFKKEAPQWVVSAPRVDERWSPLVHTLEGHDELVMSVAFSTDGKLLASASFDRTVKVWDAATGDVVRTLKGHDSAVASVAFSPNGKLLASASDDRTLKVWNAATGEVQQTLEGHRKSVKSVAFSPDGKLLASASSDGIVKVWNAATGDIIRTLQESYHVRSVAFSPDGKLLASASYGGTVEVWDTATGDLVRTLKDHGQSWFILVAYTHNKKLLALQSKSKTIKVWDAATGNVDRTLKGHGKVVTSAAFSSDGKWLALTLYDMLVRVLDAATGEVVRTLDGHDGWVRSVAFSPDGKLLASASDDRTVKVWDAAAGDVVRAPECHGHWVSSVAFSPDGKLLASASYDKTVQVWDAATGDIVRTLKSHSHYIRSVVFSSDGKLLASASHDRTVKVWDAATGDIVHTLKGHGNTVTSVTFSPDGKLLASASLDNTAKVWDVATDIVARTLGGHSCSVWSVVFSPDGKLLASASRDMTVKVWDAATGDIVRTLKGHGNTVTSVTFSPDGKLLASASLDKTVKVWDAATGEVKQTLQGYGRTVSFDNIGLYLFTDAGSIKFDDVTRVGSTGPVQSRFQSQPQRMQWRGYGLSHDKSWITWNGHNVLWLPPECRPLCLATWCSAAPSLMARFAIGCRSGRVIVIGFAGPPASLPSSGIINHGRAFASYHFLR